MIIIRWKAMAFYGHHHTPLKNINKLLDTSYEGTWLALERDRRGLSVPIYRIIRIWKAG